MKEKSASKEETTLPPIFRVGSVSSEDSEGAFDVRHEKSTDEHNAETEVRSVRLPTIDVSRNNSVTSFTSAPNSRGTRNSRERSRRRVLCKSPSCPSNLGISRQQSHDLESPTATDKTVLNSSPGFEDKENDLKLPNIFRSANSLSLPAVPTQNISIHSWQAGGDGINGLRRSESFREAYITSPVLEPKVKNHQRSQTHAALLLPLRTGNNDTRRNVKGNTKKKKNQTEHNGFIDAQNSARSDVKSGAQSGWENEYESDIYDSARGQKNSSFDRIMEESDSSCTPQLDISSTRKMKPWLKDRATQKEGQVKA